MTGWAYALLWMVAVILLTLMLIHIHCIQSRMYDVYRTCDDGCKVIPSSVSSSSHNVERRKMRFLSTCESTMYQWYDCISRAKHEVIICTYDWMVFRQYAPKNHKRTEREVTPQLIVIGMALRRAQQNHPDVCCRIMFNRNPYSTSQKSICERIAYTLSIWKSMGVNIMSPNISFDVWDQYVGSNMHSKLVVVDRTEVVLGSGNVQFAVHEGPALWGECGLWVECKEWASQCCEYVTNLCDGCCMSYVGGREGDGGEYHHRKGGVHVLHFQAPWKEHGLQLFCIPPLFAASAENSRQHEYTLSSLHSHTPDTMTLEQYEQNVRDAIQSIAEDGHVVVAAHSSHLILTYPNTHLWNAQWNPQFDPMLVVIKQARNHIYVFTPNFHQPTLWRELLCAAKRGVQVHIITGRNFNAEKSRVCKWGIGFPSNVEFLREQVCKEWHRHPELKHTLHWRWYAAMGCTFVDYSTRSSHEKLILVDSEWIGTGSLNFTVISIHNASEVWAMVQSRELYESIWREFACDRWNQGTRVTLHPDYSS